MATYSYIKRSLRCYVTIGDAAKEYDAVQVTTDFALNSIPTATVTLALGMNIKTNEQSTAAELEDSLFTFRKPIKIYTTYSTDSEFLSDGLKKTEAVGPDELIFDGYIAGVGYQRTASGAVLSVSAEHWLSDLAASSMMGASTHSMTPGDLQRAAMMVSARPLSGAAQANTYGILSSTWSSKILGNSLDFVNNLWDGGIKKIAKGGAEAEALIDVNRSADSACASSAKNINNQAALEALDKINGVLPLRLSSAENIVHSIRKDLSSLFLENLAGQTIWDVIISASANYMFAVAPGVNTADVLPFLPCISTALSTDAGAFSTIKAEQIFSVSLSSDMPRTIRGVAVLFSTETTVLGSGGKQTTLPALRVGGAYIGTADCKGTILYKQPPSWLSTSSATFYAQGTDKDTNRPIKTGTNTAGGTPSNLPGKTENITNTMQIRDDYAKSLYGFEILKGRQGTISGPFRMDIGVGSYIEFELPENLHSPGSVGKYFRAIVLRVSSSLDAQSSQATTTFTVGYARTQVEDADNILTMTNHPIYTSIYLGNRLDI